MVLLNLPGSLSFPISWYLTQYTAGLELHSSGTIAAFNSLLYSAIEWEEGVL